MVTVQLQIVLCNVGWNKDGATAFNPKMASIRCTFDKKQQLVLQLWKVSQVRLLKLKKK